MKYVLTFLPYGKVSKNIILRYDSVIHCVMFGIKMSSIEKLVICVPMWEIRLNKQNFCSVIFATTCLTNRQRYSRPVFLNLCETAAR